jgi:hypothetical protein
MNANSIADDLQKAQQERQQAQTEELKKLSQTLKSDLQTALLAESKSFRSSIAQAETKLRRLLWAALVTTALSVLLTSYLILTAERSARQLNDQAQLLLESQRASEALRELNMVPVGDLVKSPDGRTLIEVKPLKE